MNKFIVQHLEHAINAFNILQVHGDTDGILALLEREDLEILASRIEALELHYDQEVWIFSIVIYNILKDYGLLVE